MIEQNKHRYILIMGYFGILVTIVSSLITQDALMRSLSSNVDAYMDFFNHIKYCEIPKDVYFQSKHACFPALAYCFYFILGKLLPSSAITMWKADKTAPAANFLYIIYVVLLTVILCCLMSYVLKKYSKKYIVIFEILVFFSSAFLCTLERGNSSYIVLILLLAAILFKESDKRYHNEIALICIALAAAFKIYPAVFGLLYLSEKKYKEAIRLVIYGVLFFFVPFAFFGGISGFKQFLKNQVAIQTTEISRISIKGILECVLINIDNTIITMIFYVVMVFVLVILLATFFKTKRFFIKVSMLVCAMVLLPSWNGFYTSSYFLIPLLLYLRDENHKYAQKSLNMASLVITISFSMIFTLFRIPIVCESFSIFCVIGVYLLFVSSAVFAFIESKGKGQQDKETTFIAYDEEPVREKMLY